MFFTIEGIEGSGKTTLLKEIEKEISSLGYKVKITTEPRGIDNEIGEKITEIIQKREIDGLSEFLLFSAFRNFHIKNFIKPWLKEGHIVICDRFVDSSVVYQGFVKKVDPKLIKNINKEVLNNLKPDKVFLIDLDPKISSERISIRDKKTDKFDVEDLSFHYKVRDGYLRLAKKNKNFIIIDGNCEITKIRDEIISIIVKEMSIAKKRKG